MMIFTLGVMLLTNLKLLHTQTHTYLTIRAWTHSSPPTKCSTHSSYHTRSNAVTFTCLLNSTHSQTHVQSMFLEECAATGKRQLHEAKTVLVISQNVPTVKRKPVQTAQSNITLIPAIFYLLYDLVRASS